jgi:hypothetical protein
MAENPRLFPEIRAVALALSPLGLCRSVLKVQVVLHRDTLHRAEHEFA